jgi:hypothetical protein
MRLTSGTNRPRRQLENSANRRHPRGRKRWRKRLTNDVTTRLPQRPWSKRSSRSAVATRLQCGPHCPLRALLLTSNAATRHPSSHRHWQNLRLPMSDAAMRQPNKLRCWRNWHLLGSDVAMRWRCKQRCLQRALSPTSTAVTRQPHELWSWRDCACQEATLPRDDCAGESVG